MIQRRPYEVGQNCGQKLEACDDKQIKAQFSQIHRAYEQLAACCGHPESTRYIGKRHQCLAVNSAEEPQNIVAQAQNDLDRVDDTQNIDVQKQAL